MYNIIYNITLSLSPTLPLDFWLTLANIGFPQLTHELPLPFFLHGVASLYVGNLVEWEIF